MGPGSLGVPLPVGLGPAALLAPLESPGWGQTLVSPSFGFPYGYVGTGATAGSGYPMQCYPQHAAKGIPAMPGPASCNTDAGGGSLSKRTTADTATWYSQQQTADSAAALAAAAGAGWPLQQLQQQRRAAPSNPDDVVRRMLHGEAAASEPSTQQEPQQQRASKSHKQVHRSNSFSSAHATVALAALPSPAYSNGSYGGGGSYAAAAFAAMQSAQLQAAMPTCSDGRALPGSMLSPAAYVHNAQQMLLQQSQQMQVMQQQQVVQQQHVLLSIASQQQRQQHHHYRDSAASAPAVSSTPAPAAVAALQQHKPRAQQQQQRPAEVVTPHTMRAALGDRAFFSMRCMMVKQQETFVAQLFELHRLSRVQAMLQAEVDGEHHQLTQEYEQEAVASLQCSQALQQQSGGAAAVSSQSLPAAAAASMLRKQTKQLQMLLAGARPVAGDDRGAAAVASLPVHVALLANLPSTLRAAVAQPAVTDYSTLNPNTYYIRQAPGMLRPTPMRYVGRSSGKGGSSSGMAIAAAAGARFVAPAASCEETVQVGERMAPPAAVHGSRSQGQHKRGLPQRSASITSLQSGRHAAAAAEASSAAAAGAGMLPSPRALSGLDRVAIAAGRAKPPLSPAAAATSKGCSQQQQDMPPPPRMAPEQAAQHAAAAAAQHHQQQMQHEQQQAAAAVMDAAAGMQQGAAGLKVFRPMPQIDPSFASKFLAGGQGCAGAAAALGAAAPRFDPHSYWMSKHYGGGAASSQQQQQQQPQTSSVSAQAGQDAAAAAAAVASGVMGGAMAAAAAAARGVATATTVEAGSAGDAASHQQQLSMADASGLAGLAAAAAAAASAAAMDPAAAAATPRPVVHWWQDAAATFGEIGLVDPNVYGAGSKSDGTPRKRDFPQQYSLQHLPHKKRVKHAAAAAGSNGGSYYSGGYGYGYDQAAAGMGGWEGTPEGAFQPPRRCPAASQERSRVRSNHMGGSRQCESSVCSDNSASSIDNPSYMAAAAAAAAAGPGELGPDADGVSLLLHMGHAAAAQHAAGSAVAGRKGSHAGRGSGTGGRGSGTGGGGRSHSCAASAVGGTGGRSTAKSAAGILLSLSASQSDAV